MPNKRIIPCLDTNKGRVVKGVQFENVKEIDDPVKLAKHYNDTLADEIVLYDITASTEGRDIFLDVVKNVAAVVSIPFAVGGGIRTLEDIEQVLQAGADKVSINSAAIKNPTLIKEAAAKFGSKKIVVAIDAKEMEQNKWNVHEKGGKQDTGIDAIEWAKKMVDYGASELVINSINEDGAKTGYNLPLTKQIAELVDASVVASGGAGSKEHFADVLKNTKADAALAASVFHFGEIDIPDLKDYLADEGINVRREKA